jgi:hypothetical protein
MYSRKKKKGGASLNVFGRKATKFVFSLNKRPQMWLQSYRQPLAPTIKLLAVTAAGRVQENSGLIFAPVIGSKPVAFQSSSLPAPSLFLLRAPRRSGFFPLLSKSLLQDLPIFGRDSLVLFPEKSSCIIYVHMQFQFRFYFKKIGPVDVLKGGLESQVLCFLFLVPLGCVFGALSSSLFVLFFDVKGVFDFGFLFRSLVVRVFEFVDFLFVCLFVFFFAGVEVTF